MTTSRITKRNLFFLSEIKIQALDRPDINGTVKCLRYEFSEKDDDGNVDHEGLNVSIVYSTAKHSAFKRAK